MNKYCPTALYQYPLTLFIILSCTHVFAQGCNSAIIQTAPDVRFQDNGDGTVIDKHIDVMWTKCARGKSGSNCEIGAYVTFSWDKALQEAENINISGGFAGYTDWRLPNRKELESLVEDACEIPAINDSIFPNATYADYSNYPTTVIDFSNYWTSSPSTAFTNSAFFVGFALGFSDFQPRATTNIIRLIRDLP